jgi:membrane protein implicated in regulation of membrane protease activity
MLWWMWVVLGLVLVAIEAAAPGGFFIFFFGVGAFLVGLLVALGWAGPAWVQWFLFTALSVVALGVLRKPLQGRVNVRGAQRPVDSLVGEAAIVTGAIEAGGVGKVELRGAAWNARSGAGAIAAGQRCLVERVDGLTLWVRPE